VYNHSHIIDNYIILLFYLVLRFVCLLDTAILPTYLFDPFFRYIAIDYISLAKDVCWRWRQQKSFNEALY